MKKIVYIVFSFLLAVFAVGCSDSNVRLYDYKNTSIPLELLNVADNDVMLSIQMSLQEKMITVHKETNRFVVEENDVVTIVVNETNTSSSYEVKFTIGDELIHPHFDKYLLGKTIGEQYTFVEDDIDISFEILDIATLAQTITDEVAQEYFNFSSAEEMINTTRNKIIDHRVFEYQYSVLLTKSLLRTNIPERSDYIESINNDNLHHAKEHNMTIDEWLESEYGVTVSEFNRIMQEFYDEYLILEALMIQEQVDISEQAVEAYLKSLAEELELSQDEVSELYSDVDIRYQMYYETSYAILLKYS